MDQDINYENPNFIIMKGFELMNGSYNLNKNQIEIGK